MGKIRFIHFKTQEIEKPNIPKPKRNILYLKKGKIWFIYLNLLNKLIFNLDKEDEIDKM